MGSSYDAIPTPSGSRLGPRWYVVSTYAQAERRACHHLSEQGYEVYLPLVTVIRRDRVLRTLIHRVQIPLFQSYLFVRFDVRDPWRPITNTPGVFRLLTNSGHFPDPVPEAEISALQATEASRRCQAPETTQWAPGALCSLLAGPFAGLPAIVTSVHRDEATITLMFLGHLRNVSVSLDCLKARDDD